MLTINFDLFKVKGGEVMLDVGCGSGRHSLNVKTKDATILSLDIDKDPLNNLMEMLGGADKVYNGNKIHLIRGDVLWLPIRDESVDKIVCSELLEHVKEDESCIQELWRVLKPGGGLAVSVPTRFSELLYERLADRYLGKPGGHIRVYNPDELVKKLENAGFNVWDTETAHSLHFFYWLLRAIFGIEEENNLLPSIYCSFLERADRSIFGEKIEAKLNRACPKSFVIYAQKEN